MKPSIVRKRVEPKGREEARYGAVYLSYATHKPMRPGSATQRNFFYVIQPGPCCPQLLLSVSQFLGNKTTKLDGKQELQRNGTELLSLDWNNANEAGLGHDTIYIIRPWDPFVQIKSSQIAQTRGTRNSA